MFEADLLLLNQSSDESTVGRMSDREFIAAAKIFGESNPILPYIGRINAPFWANLRMRFALGTSKCTLLDRIPFKSSGFSPL